MKKLFSGFMILTIALTLFLGFFGIRSIDAAYRQEIRNVTNLAGAVLSEYPESKQTVLSAIQDNSFTTYQEGCDILIRYGYDEERKVNENIFYQRFSRTYMMTLMVFLLLMLGLGGCFFLSISRKQKHQETALLEIVDHYFSENYQFISHVSLQDKLDNPVLTELLIRLGENLQQKTEYLSKERDNTKTLVTDISHQLKTPISALKTCFSMYLEADTPEEKAEFLNRSQLQMDKLEALISSLIQISRLETSLITLNQESVTLTELLLGAVNSIYHKASAKEISIETDDFDDMTLKLDRKWTTEALVNILDNAVKYSSPGSCIRIRVQSLISFVRIELEDEGIGILPEERNQIFHRFYRNSKEEVRQTEGSGVGLYLTRKILEDQGGTVTVHPAPGQGSVFVVQLPYVREM